MLISARTAFVNAIEFHGILVSSPFSIRLARQQLSRINDILNCGINMSSSCVKASNIRMYIYGWWWYGNESAWKYQRTAEAQATRVANDQGGGEDSRHQGDERRSCRVTLAMSSGWTGPWPLFLLPTSQIESICFDRSQIYTEYERGNRRWS